MKSSRYTLAVTVLAASALFLPAQVMAQDTASLPTEKERVGYMIGMDIGKSIKPMAGEFDVAMLKRAIDDVLSGKPTLLDEQEVATVMQAFSQKMQAKQQAAQKLALESNAAAGEAFLAQNGKKSGIVTTASGLQYQVLSAGKGAMPKAESTVKVHYIGTLLDGTKFDSSHDRNEPAQFALGAVIPGWTEGLQLMPAGSKYRFWIPARLAYGDQGTPGGPIAPGSTLVFEVELLEVL
jgi:FKBP-type peptidyl-prolyl cis-trans isomerase FkpA